MEIRYIASIYLPQIVVVLVPTQVNSHTTPCKSLNVGTTWLIYALQNARELNVTATTVCWR